MFNALSGTAGKRMQTLKINSSKRWRNLLVDAFDLFIVVITNGEDLALLSSF